MGDAVRVSVQCPHCRVIGHGADAKYTAGICQHCCMTRASFAYLAPGSLSDAIYRLGLAASKLEQWARGERNDNYNDLALAVSSAYDEVERLTDAAKT